ncbi:Bud22p KNAG_0M02090 [Huiozyma naganishii CBS 8797]|uniref:Bud22 domain-containing protein n=1 Tax=Huiozyma naganishii (strain ATCC MYA-139 / BCRC 22969 / CBS 8797 / KCTC 17520 / NBRC 10181 / NCYC 3082 / Yp74L-3) TaxID=1071383 RepID=J7S493_HUIN7|nr:hypothetical protein KNAG_0M02090 [Kazachstania naganishii CBS 8797]CCK73062.1 hypothetical protein KNAG_0M02090 [Kazachstania naganishii CBS 8797]
MARENLTLKLDHLEYRYHHAAGTLGEFRPRLAQTGKFFTAKGKRTSRRVSELLGGDAEELLRELDALRLQIFENKVYSLEKHLRVHLLKKTRQMSESAKVVTPAGGLKMDEFVPLVVKAKAIKVATGKVGKGVPWAQDHEYFAALREKTHVYNPGRVWNEVVCPMDGGVKLHGVLFNDKRVKSILETFDNGMDLFLNNRRERTARDGDKPESEAEVDDDDSEGSTSEEEEGEEEPVEHTEEQLEKYADMLVGTDDESDESSSEEESSGQKRKLPELMAGYYSGEEDDSAEEDLVARQQLSNKPERKNRRGQRARRKIWEQKYGTQAAHVQREYAKQREEREKRQAEYEQRVAKREARTNANLTALGERRPRDAAGGDAAGGAPVARAEDHPSWVAKKLAEEKLKNAKFSGKKIKFD